MSNRDTSMQARHRTRVPFVASAAVLRRTLLASAQARLSAQAQAPEDVRVALVIGNASYAGPAALANPANDARAMSAALRTLGFSVEELRDASRAQMLDAVAKLGDKLRSKQ